MVKRTRPVLVLPVTGVYECNAVVAMSFHLKISFNHSHPSVSPVPSGRIIMCDMNY